MNDIEFTGLTINADDANALIRIKNKYNDFSDWFRVTAQLEDYEHIDKVNDWLVKNCISPFTFYTFTDNEYSDNVTIVLRFANQDDAFMFKLRDAVSASLS